MHHTDVFSAHFKLKLSEGFNKGHSFNVTHCTSKLQGDSNAKQQLWFND